MSDAKTISDCERESAERVRRLEAELAAQRKEIERLRRRISDQDTEIDGLKSALARATTCSSNSSKPPSSDIVKRQRPAPSGSRRKIGAQPGHPLHVRAPFKPEEIDAIVEHSLACCPDCAGPLDCYPGAHKIVQQMDVQPLPVRVEEHRAGCYWCAKCKKQHIAPLPPHVEKGGLCGPYLTTLAAYLKGACHASFSTIRKFLRDIAGIKISRGHLRNLIAKVSAALDGPYEELLKLLPLQRYLNVDETGHKENGERPWTWCFRAELFVLFKIEFSRGSNVLMEVLGKEFDGVLGCDYFSAYRKYMGKCGVEVQFCLAHLIRDVKYLLELPDAKTRAYGAKLLSELRLLFEIIHRRDELGAAACQAGLEHMRGRILQVARENVPPAREAQNMARRFELHGAAYFQFITTPGMEPTNNLAEQAIRFVVLDRMVTQGTRGEMGRRWCERIWSTLATCAIQGVSAFDYLARTLRSHFTGGAPPSLLPNTA